MKISFTSEGGYGVFPGLDHPLELNSKDLPPEEAQQLEQLIRDGDFYNISAGTAGKSRGAADVKTYTISIDDKGKKHSVALTDVETDAKLQNLLTYLKKKQKESRSS